MRSKPAICLCCGKRIMKAHGRHIYCRVCSRAKTVMISRVRALIKRHPLSQEKDYDFQVQIIMRKK